VIQLTLFFILGEILAQHGVFIGTKMKNRKDFGLWIQKGKIELIGVYLIIGREIADIKEIIAIEVLLVS